MIMQCSRNSAKNPNASIKPIHYLILKMKELVSSQPWVRIVTLFVARIIVFASAFDQELNIVGHPFQLTLILIHISFPVFTNYIIKWDASFWWLFCPKSACGSIETMTFGKTHSTLRYITWVENNSFANNWLGRDETSM